MVTTVGLKHLVMVLLVGALTAPLKANESPATIDNLIERGQFSEATIRLDAELSQANVDQTKREHWRWQREWMRRLRLDFSLNQQDVFSGLQKQIPDLSQEQFTTWKRQGLFDTWFIDGEERYFSRSVSNLFELDKLARQRRSSAFRGGDDGPLYSPHAHHRQVIELANKKNANVLPVRLRITHRLSVAANAVPAGETLRAWIPYPREIAEVQPSVKFIQASANKKSIASNTALQRTVYFEDSAKKSRATEFEVSYEVTRFAQHHKIDAKKSKLPKIDDALQQYVSEQGPHIQFTPALREYNNKLIGQEKNPYRIAKKLFEAVSAMPWVGAWEYSLIPNISEYLMQRKKGDCGQKSLLLITLLRMNGIPARWQSGWQFADVEWDTMHDWTWFYLEPYGWMPLDSTHGVLNDKDERVKYFYLGGMDAYRVAFNDDISAPFEPAKQFVRSETVDSQRGEVEWAGGNLYFDQWKYDLKWEIVSDR